MQSRFSKRFESFPFENQKHPLAPRAGNAGIVMEKLLIVLELSLSVSFLQAERLLTISGVSYQNALRFAHKNFSLSQFSSKKDSS